MSDILLGPLTLPEDLEWIDEYGTGSDLVGQQETVTITGAVIIQASAQQSGRKVTLQGRTEGNVGFAAIPKAMVDSLRGLAATAGAAYSLTLADGRVYSVAFRRSDGPAIEAAAFKVIAPTQDDDLYYPTIRLIML